MRVGMAEGLESEAQKKVDSLVVEMAQTLADAKDVKEAEEEAVRRMEAAMEGRRVAETAKAAAVSAKDGVEAMLASEREARAVEQVDAARVQRTLEETRAALGELQAAEREQRTSMAETAASLQQVRATLADTKGRLECTSAELSRAHQQLDDGTSLEAELSSSLSKARDELASSHEDTAALQSKLDAADGTLTESAAREAEQCAQIRSLEGQSVELATELSAMQCLQVSTAQTLSDTRADLEATAQRESNLEARASDLTAQLNASKQAELEKRDAIAALVLSEVAATRKEAAVAAAAAAAAALAVRHAAGEFTAVPSTPTTAAASPLEQSPTAPALGGSLGETHEQRWLAATIRREADAEKAEFLRLQGELQATIDGYSTETSRLTSKLERSRQSEATLSRQTAEAQQAVAEASAATAAAQTAAVQASERAARAIADMEVRTVAREVAAAEARAAAARKEADAEEGITAATRMANEVKSVEARLAAAEARFAEERLAASRIQLDWALEKEEREKQRTEAAISRIVAQKAALAEQMQTAMDEAKSWQERTKALEEEIATTSAHRAAEEAQRIKAEAKVVESEAALEEERANLARGDELGQRANGERDVACNAIREAEEETQAAREETLAVRAEKAAADARKSAVEEERQQAVQKMEEAHHKAEAAAEELKELKRQRTRDVAKAAGYARKEASREAQSEADKERERLETWARRQVIDATKRTTEAMEEKLRAREVELEASAKAEREALTQALTREQMRVVAHEREEAVRLAGEDATQRLREVSAQLAQAVREKESFKKELQSRSEQPPAMQAQQSAPKGLEAAPSTEAHQSGFLGKLFGGTSRMDDPREALWGPVSQIDDLARVVAMAHEAGVPPQAIAPEEESLAHAMRAEEGKVASQVTKLVETLDKLEAPNVAVPGSLAARAFSTPPMRPPGGRRATSLGGTQSDTDQMRKPSSSAGAASRTPVGVAMSIALPPHRAQPDFPPYASIAATRIGRSHTLRSAAAAEYEDVSALHGDGIAKPTPLLRAVTLPIPGVTVRDPAPASSPPHDADYGGAPHSQQGPATTDTSKSNGGGGGGGSSTKVAATHRPSTESKPSKPSVTLTAGLCNVPPTPPPLRRNERPGAASGSGGGGKGSGMLSHRGVSEPAASYRGSSTPPSRAVQGRTHSAARQRALRRLTHD